MLLLCYVVNAYAVKTIRFATEATYPPFEYLDASGKIKGFDIDLANALCAQMKVQCEFSNQTFQSLIPSLKLGKFDAVISTLNITPEREKQVAFTHPYYLPSGSFVGLTDKHYSLSNLTGKTIGVQQSSTFEKYLQDKFGDKITIKTYAGIQDTFLDLASGRVDLVLADTPIAQEWLQRDNNSKQYSVIDKPFFDAHYFGTGYGIAVNQRNKELLTALNKALADVKANGTYTKIFNQYFSK